MSDQNAIAFLPENTIFKTEELSVINIVGVVLCSPFYNGVFIALILLPSPFVIRNNSTSSPLALLEDAAINSDEV